MICDVALPYVSIDTGKVLIVVQINDKGELLVNVDETNLIKFFLWHTNDPSLMCSRINNTLIKLAKDIATFVVIAFPLPLSVVTKKSFAILYISSVVTVTSSEVIVVCKDFSGHPFYFVSLCALAIIWDATIYFIVFS